MPTFFIVRATVPDPAQRAAFDKWYAEEHLPDAVKTLRRAEGVAVLERERSVGASGDLPVRRPRGARSRHAAGEHDSGWSRISTRPGRRSSAAARS